MMQAYIDELLTYIEKTVPLYTSISVGGTTLSEKSIAFRIMPVSPGNRFFNGQRERNIQFQIITKSDIQLQALNTLEDISDALESSNCLVITEPSYLYEENKIYYYNASFRSHITKGDE